ncbi:peptide MFS transporter [Francisella sp. Scap27]|uniref:peptide MFS transporter n=1 Tax=Francisella sp. Scap27 TaxID=2589986 RepID=UPI0015C17A80|nr:peptide MFS transporter [Francisella sp. Scap27]QLE78381.1 peptide MFS transporter [Francisella sp. Scap27]
MSNIQTKKHPRALPICFTTEMWERFGYKILLGLLVFVLLKKYNLDDSQAAVIVGGFTGLLYITSIVAGFIADKFIGYYRSVILGGIVLIIGYLISAIAPSLLILSIGLGIISVGTGLLKSNVSSLLGLSYEVGDPNRDKGFTIFYAGINIGGMLANFTAGYFYEHYGSFISFCIAASGVLLGVLIFYFGFKLSNLKPLRDNVSFTEWLSAILMVFVSIVVATFIIYNPKVSVIFFVLVIFVSIFVVIKISIHDTKQLKKSIAYLLFLAIAIVFWGIYNQMFLSMNLFIDRLVEHSFFGIPMTTQSFIIANNVGVIVFGFTIIKLWNYLNDVKKYILGMFLLCFVFMIVISGINTTSELAKIAGYWVIIAYLMLSLSEICISPIGLSLATKLAPKGKTGMFMGLWLVTMGIGGFLAGIIAKFAAIDSVKNLNVIEMKEVYNHAFTIYVGIAIVAFVLTIVIGKVINMLLAES